MRAAPSELGGPRCQAAATHEAHGSRLCATCAARLRQSLRDPHTLGNVIFGRARTEEEIARIVVELPPES
jgi:hypothetical protein